MKTKNIGVSETERVALPAKDGYPLTMFRYHSTGKSKGNILVAGATGVPQRFYSRFAEYARQLGFNVYTLDYRASVNRSQGRYPDL